VNKIASNKKEYIFALNILQKMKKIYLFLLILSLLTAYNSFGQTNFVKGYYVTLELDTVHGLIEYRSDNRNSRIFTFKKSPNGSPTSFTPAQVYAYSIENKQFFRKSSIQKKNKIKTLFLKALVLGSVSLLEGTGATYYIETKDGRLIELPKSERRIFRNGKTYISRIIYVKGYLKALVADHPELILKVENAIINPDFLKYLITEYNQVSGNELTYLPSKTPISIHPHLSFGITGSSQYAKLNILGENYSNVDFNYSWSVGAGGFLQLFIPRIDEKTKITYYLLFEKKSFYSSYRTFDKHNDLFINYSEIINALTIQKTFFKPSGFFVEAGIQHNKTFSREYRWRQERILENGIYTDYLQPPGLISPLYLGYRLGLGKEFHIGSDLYLSSMIKYSFLNSYLIKRGTLSSSINTIGLQFNLKYKKN
jgi:hypothetical protein